MPDTGIAAPSTLMTPLNASPCWPVTAIVACDGCRAHASKPTAKTALKVIMPTNNFLFAFMFDYSWVFDAA
jgi:hypothetical protein